MHKKLIDMVKAMTIIAAAMMLAASCTAKQGGANEAQAAEGKVAGSGKKVLVAYFSCTGTTEAAAKAVAEATGGKLYRIQPKQPYTAADLDWNDKASRSTAEMTNPAARPELADRGAKVEQYDVVFLGYPIWWDQCPRIIYSFMEAYTFEGKTVVPFATSGGSTIANSVSELKRLYGSGITWAEGRLLNSGADDARQWAAGCLK